MWEGHGSEDEAEDACRRLVRTLASALPTGGVVVGFFGPRPSLVADAGTFAASALIMLLWVRQRPAPDPGRRRAGMSLSDIRDGARLVFGNPRLRVPLFFGWLVAFVDVYEAVSAPLVWLVPK